MNFLTRKSIYPKLALCLAFIFSFQVFFPVVSYALTSGPTQPEVQSFTPAGVSDMVDPFSGDFSYNIPLFELPGPNGGYPFNLAYQSGIGMDQEASWVGLGWNLNVGAINRQVRGLPDEFQGDEVVVEESMKDNVTIGVKLTPGINPELFGSHSVDMNASLYYNNYNGLGISYGLGANFALAKNEKVKAGLSLNNDSQSGSSINTNVSLSNSSEKVSGGFNLGIGYSSRSGLSDLNLGISGGRRDKNINTSSSTSAISFSTPSYLPTISTPMTTNNWDLSGKIGAGAGFYTNIEIKGFYTRQKIAKPITRTAAYGYLHAEKRLNDPTALADFNREKDGMVTGETPFLGMPQLTYDIYSVQAQGISATYRPWRSDMGVISDAQQEEKSRAKSLGVDASPAFEHLGIQANYSPTINASGAWGTFSSFPNLQNTHIPTLVSSLGFQSSSSNPLYEPYYFAPVGETTTMELADFAAIGGAQALQANLTGTQLQNNLGSVFSVNNTHNEERRARNLSVLPITNKDLNNTNVLPEYAISYFDGYQNPDYGLLNDPVTFDRKRPDHHIAGMTSTTTEGMRYVFGLPAYVNEQSDYLFTVVNGNTCESSVDIITDDEGKIVHKPNQDPIGISTAEAEQIKKDLRQTDQQFKKTTTPAHPHAFLLTSILGPDYVDSDGIKGVTPNDEGYHVNFQYQKVSSDYRWRAPYFGANYSEGYDYTIQDDKGSFTTGTKEIFYIHKAETKSHVAIFNIKPREDGRGANIIQNDASDVNNSHLSYKLIDIKLYTREAYETNGKPIKTITFDYDYLLCPKTQNNFTSSAKLTLAGIQISYGDSKRGEVNPYVFKYKGLNPSYDTYAQDRWGNFRTASTMTSCEKIKFPYVDQTVSKEEHDKNASAWNLTNIELPSGGEIEVTYEADDYGYVQNKKAMQMVEIVSVGKSPTSTEKETLSDSQNKVFFKLKETLSKSSVTDAKKEASKYIDLQTNQLYFNINIALRKANTFEEQVRGYADIIDYGLYDDGSSSYTYGYVEVQNITTGSHTVHPFTLAAWQHVQFSAPKLMSMYNSHPDKGNITDQIVSLLSTVTMQNMIVDFYGQAKGLEWGRKLNLNESWIRLNVPDLQKIGGGHRVKQITYTDNWQQEGGSSTYGQVYDYTHYDPELKQQVSSGVATYEPMVGSDETALRYAKKYKKESVGIKDQYLFMEVPINESYFPGASVGYAKVTVRSLANATQEGIATSINLPAGIMFSTSATSVSEFYTAKDYPIITSYTNKKTDENKKLIPVPPIALVQSTEFVATQGYTIELNDMHGKPKRMASYPQEIQKGGAVTLWDKPINWTEYYYQNDKRIVDGKEINVLNNTCQTLKKDDGSQNLSAGNNMKSRLVGINYEFFGDSREYVTRSRSYGAEANTDGILPYIIPNILPDYSESKSEFRSLVFNKIIQRSGIISSVKAYDGSAILETKNLLWDAQTGQVLLTQVNNNFDNPLFSYTILAHPHYKGMGPAYHNIGLRLKGTIQGVFDPSTKIFTTSANQLSPAITEKLITGDEFIIYYGSQRYRSVVVSKTNSYPFRASFYIEGTPSNFNPPYLTELFLYRSGRRNLLGAPAANITTLMNPISSGSNNENRNSLNISSLLKIPTNCQD
ncbi:hypothetical protein ACE193_25395 (plasmid) [Bernardetia sp. OM2101]|uniref:hypothetical protein n=1 Tax=Bernardetia sp. OM2101 TaxID=3344876 RepID=UPI0035CF407D